MTRRLAALAALAAVLGVLPPPSGHAAEGLLVVRGSRSGWVDVTMPSEFSVDVFADDPLAKGTPTYAAFYAERLGQPYSRDSDHFGVARVGRGTAGPAVAHVMKGLAPAPEGNFQNAFSDVTPVMLSAGTYRFWIATDRPFEMWLPTTGIGRTVVVTPRKPLKAALSGFDLTPTANTWQGRGQARVAGRTVAVALTYVGWVGSAVQTPLLWSGYHCFAATGANCADTTFTYGSWAKPGVRGEGSSAGAFAPPGSLAAGTWDTVHTIGTATGGTVSATGYVLTFEAP